MSGCPSQVPCSFQQAAAVAKWGTGLSGAHLRQKGFNHLLCDVRIAIVTIQQSSRAADLESVVHRSCCVSVAFLLLFPCACKQSMENGQAKQQETGTLPCTGELLSYS